MGNIEEPKEVKGVSIPNPCDNIRIAVHNRSIVDTPVVVVHSSGETKTVGLAFVCHAQAWIKDGMQRCSHIESVKRFKSWPSGLSDGDFQTIAKLGPSYWDRWAVHIAQTQDGVWHNFNELNCVPPFISPDNLTHEYLRIMQFRARHDPSLPEDIRKLFGRLEKGGIQGMLLDAVTKPSQADPEMENMPI